MLCIAIAQESRRLALVDMLNASQQCDLIELRLDCFEKAPDVAEILQHKPKPLILSCRRPKDGGNFKGSEEERLAILRQCIVSKADYVEIELDAADQIRRFPPAKRVITYTNLQGMPEDIAAVYAEAKEKSPDVIKLVVNARTPEEAWPLLQIVARQTVPTVVVGLGKPGVMLSVLGKKIGAPFAYAALEKGMEAYPGQPSVRELREIYHYDEIGKGTRLLAVTGFGDDQVATVAGLNAIAASLKAPVRCLPIGLGSMPVFRKVMDAVKLSGVIVESKHRGAILGITSSLAPSAEAAQAADLLLPGDQGWVGHDTASTAALAALERVVKEKSPADRPLQGKMVMVVGVNALARAFAHAARARGARLIIASRHKEQAHELAQALECRYVQFEALYSTLHEVIVICDDEVDQVRSKDKEAAAGLHPGYLKSTMVVMDLTAPRLTSFARDAKARGCGVVDPRMILPEQIASQAQLVFGKAPDAAVLNAALAPFLEET